MTIAEKFEQKGLEKGLEIGRKEGIQEVARTMLAKGLDIKEVQELADLKIQTVSISDFKDFGRGLESADFRIGKRHLGVAPLSNSKDPKSDHQLFRMQREN